jgi:hypothetical protein
MLHRLLGGLAALAIAGAANAQDWSGTYTSTSVLSDGYTHTETDLVTGLQVTGVHTFTNGSSSGEFDWTGTLSPTSPTSATLTGSGTIHNLGVRPFTIEFGGLYLNNDVFTLYWSGIDPRFGPIGWTTYMAAPVPEPETYALMLAGLGLLGFVARRRNQKEAASA